MLFRSGADILFSHRPPCFVFFAQSHQEKKAVSSSTDYSKLIFAVLISASLQVSELCLCMAGLLCYAT